MNYERMTTKSRHEAAEANRVYIHISCEARMIQDPKSPTPRLIPYVEHGTMYNEGKNKAKRQRRIAKAQIKRERQAAKRATNPMQMQEYTR